MDGVVGVEAQGMAMAISVDEVEGPPSLFFQLRGGGQEAGDGPMDEGGGAL